MATELESNARSARRSASVRAGRTHWNLGPAALYEEALRRQEGSLAADGPLVCRTGQHTGRSPNDKFVVREASSERHIHWGAVNRAIDEASFDTLHRDMLAYLQDKDLFVLDALGGNRSDVQDADSRGDRVRLAQPLRAEHVPARERRGTSPAHQPEFTVIDAPNFKADPAKHGTRSDVFIVVHFRRKLVLIGGTHYAGEIKKSIFTDPELHAAAAGRHADALLGEHRHRTAIPRSSSACRARARRRCRAIRSGA